jgi:hypothetical protein
MMYNKWGTVMFSSAIHSLYMASSTLYNDSQV